MIVEDYNPLYQDLCSINGGNGALLLGSFIGAERAYVLTIRIRNGQPLKVYVKSVVRIIGIVVW